MPSLIVLISLTISCNRAFVSVTMCRIFFSCNSDVPFVQKIWNSWACSCCSYSVSGLNFLLTYPCPFCLGTVNNLSGKQPLATDDFVAYKDGHEVCDGDGDISIEDSVNEGSSDAPPIDDQGQENVKQRMLWLQIRRFLSGLRFLTQPQRNGKKSICLNDRKLLSNYHMTC